MAAREAGNEAFAFVADARAPGGAYYRWLVFALANGDAGAARGAHARTAPFRMFAGSAAAAGKARRDRDSCGSHFSSDRNALL